MQRQTAITLMMGWALFAISCSRQSVTNSDVPRETKDESATQSMTKGGNDVVSKEAASKTFALDGVWMHQIPWNDGQDRTLILRGTRDEEGKIFVEFLQQFYSYKPIFAEYTESDHQAEIRFNMVMYGDETNVTEHTLRYALKEETGLWSGQLFHSWEPQPYDITLTETSAPAEPAVGASGKSHGVHLNEPERVRD
jgi:hypothetical protein